MVALRSLAHAQAVWCYCRASPRDKNACANDHWCLKNKYSRANMLTFRICCGVVSEDLQQFSAAAARSEVCQPRNVITWFLILGRCRALCQYKRCLILCPALVIWLLSITVRWESLASHREAYLLCQVVGNAMQQTGTLRSLEDAVTFYNIYIFFWTKRLILISTILTTTVNGKATGSVVFILWS